MVALGVPVSIDSMKAEVVAFALDQGAMIANDVWGLQRDAGMAPLVAARGVPVIVMHNRDSVDPAIDIIAEMKVFFQRSLEIAAQAGIAREKIVLDPGIGFGKTAEQSMIALARLRESRRYSACQSLLVPRENASSPRCRRRSRRAGLPARSPRTSSPHSAAPGSSDP